jgi:hypothetical protein
MMFTLRVFQTISPHDSRYGWRFVSAKFANILRLFAAPVDNVVLSTGVALTVSRDQISNRRCFSSTTLTIYVVHSLVLLAAAEQFNCFLRFVPESQSKHGRRPAGRRLYSRGTNGIIRRSLRLSYPAERNGLLGSLILIQTQAVDLTAREDSNRLKVGRGKL